MVFLWFVADRMLHFEHFFILETDILETLESDSSSTCKYGFVRSPLHALLNFSAISAPASNHHQIKSNQTRSKIKSNQSKQERTNRSRDRRRIGLVVLSVPPTPSVARLDCWLPPQSSRDSLHLGRRCRGPFLAENHAQLCTSTCIIIAIFFFFFFFYYFCLLACHELPKAARKKKASTHVHTFFIHSFIHSQISMRCAAPQKRSSSTFAIFAER